MAVNDQDKAIKLIALTTGATAALELVELIRSGKVQPGDNFPPDLMNLLASMAEVQIDTLAGLQQILAALNNIGGVIQAYPANGNTVEVSRVICGTALKPEQFPNILIRDGFALSIEADAGNAAPVWVARSSGNTADPNHSKPIRPGLSAAYFVQNASNLWVMATVPNDSVILSVEVD